MESCRRSPELPLPPTRARTRASSPVQLSFTASTDTLSHPHRTLTPLFTLSSSASEVRANPQRSFVRSPVPDSIASLYCGLRWVPGKEIWCSGDVVPATNRCGDGAKCRLLCVRLVLLCSTSQVCFTCRDCTILPKICAFFSFDTMLELNGLKNQLFSSTFVS